MHQRPSTYGTPDDHRARSSSTSFSICAFASPRIGTLKMSSMSRSPSPLGLAWKTRKNRNVENVVWNEISSGWKPNGTIQSYLLVSYAQMQRSDLPQVRVDEGHPLRRDKHLPVPLDGCLFDHLGTDAEPFEGAIRVSSSVFQSSSQRRTDLFATVDGGRIGVSGRKGKRAHLCDIGRQRR